MLNNLSAMEVMELMDKVEMVEPTRFIGSEANTIDLIFFKAFGMDWEKVREYKEFREYASKGMQLIRNNNNDCYLVVM